MEINGLSSEIINSPHCLIAGCTGSGKSTTLDMVLHDIVAAGRSYAIIDLKRVSLLPWRDNVQCLAYATEPETALSLLRQMSATMDERFKRLEYQRQQQLQGHHIYLVIDEAADLLDTVPESLSIIKRIVRLARAVNIHVVFCSQDPSRKTLNPALVQNISCRLALRTTSAIESRQITGYPGAENLPQYGQGYLRTPKHTPPILVNIPKII